MRLGNSKVDRDGLYASCYDFFHIAILKQRAIDVGSASHHYEFGDLGSVSKLAWKMEGSDRS